MKVPKIKCRIYHPFSRIITELSKAFEEKGDIIELSGFPLRVFCFRDPKDIEIIFKDPLVSAHKCNRLVPRLKWYMPKSLVMNKGREKDELKRRIHRKEVKKNFSTMPNCADLTWSLLDDICENWKQAIEPINIYQDLLQFTTILGYQFLFSVKPNPEELDILLKDSYEVESQLTKRFLPILPFGDDRRYRRAVKRIRTILRNRLIEKNKIIPTTEQLDEVMSHYFSFRLATPPISLGISLIANNVGNQKKLNQALFNNEFDTMMNLPYLDNVVSEVLRLYPSAWGIPRYCKKGITIRDFKIPANSILIPSIYHTHRNPNVYDEPLKFNPERWDKKQGSAFSRLEFAQGKRRCLGGKIASAILKTSFAKIFSSFNLQHTVEQEKDLVSNLGYGFHPENPPFFYVRTIENLCLSHSQSQTKLRLKRNSKGESVN